MQILQSQSDICKRFEVTPQLPRQADRLGIALHSLGSNPINGMRVPSLSGSAGWFIYGGDAPSSDDGFYSPLCVRHVGKHCELVVPYLCLPVGWRFQIDSDGYEDVWYDKSLLKPNAENGG